MKAWTLDELCRMIDHTNLHADASEADMAELCHEALANRFAMVAVNQVQSAACKQFLAGSDVHVGAAISFPLGQTTIASKVFDTRDAIACGADEIDYVVNLTEVKNGRWGYIEDEMTAIVGACRELGAIVKVIFENCYLADAEKIRLCEIARKVRPDFIKTSTGFGTGGATFDDVRLMVEHVGPDVQVKAAGGIRSAETFLEFVRLGCTRIGTSAGVAIKAELEAMLADSGRTTIEL